MKQEYNSPFYDVKNNFLLRNCYVDKGKKPLEVDELKECVFETLKENSTSEYYEKYEPQYLNAFDYLAKKIKFDDDEKVTMDEFIRLFCTRRF